MKFKPVSSSELGSVPIDGAASLSALAGDALRSRASTLGLPKLADDLKTQLLIGALFKATDGMLHTQTWAELRDEARGLLMLAIRRDGQVSSTTADALNVLNKPAVVEKYKALGNRWTISRDPGASAVEQARKELGGGGDAASTAEWLRELADALDAPVEERPFWKSKLVLLVLFLTALV